jgi:hypothetical protein
MNLHIKTPAGTIQAKPMTRKDIKRYDQILNTLTDENLREEVERELLIALMEKYGFKDTLDRFAFYSIPKEDDVEVLKEWKSQSESYHSFKDALKELEKNEEDGGSANGTEGKTSHQRDTEASQKLSKQKNGWKFLQRILSPYKGK